ncbi:hypothetical protein KP509_20G010800 [Ceratopteris richardii]|uniref:DUF4219 domain-containing protein n=1 Tax=Ceratopteris richardii TaxID=49495 RepID=A0A8T2SGF4_CERRI|nr:hypothetical protein KP509_20G010800 [Ceratopteris richardii]
MGDNITQIGGDKVNKDNYHIWSYGMENFLMGKGLWELVNGEDECPEKVLHWISIYISESLIPHIMKASTPKEAWDIIHKICDDDMVSVMLNGLGPQYKSLDTSISVRGTMPDFDELVALCMTEEVKFGLNSSRSGNSRDHAFFQNRGRGSSRGRSFSRNANTVDMPRGRGRSYSR